MIRHEMRDNRVALITIDRHERRNAVDAVHLEELNASVVSCHEAGARAVVLTGDGSAFCAGADLGRVYGDDFRTSLYRAIGTMRRLAVPVLAAVNGPAIGAGLQLALACDLRIAADRATFAVPTARNGLAVDPWTIRRLAILAGGGPARSMLLGCRTLDADAAMRLGLADARGGLEETLAWAADIVTMAPLSLGYSKRALDVLLEDQDEPNVELMDMFEACWASDDVAESRRAREAGREPSFQGR